MLSRVWCLLFNAACWVWLFVVVGNLCFMVFVGFVAVWVLGDFGFACCLLCCFIALCVYVFDGCTCWVGCWVCTLLCLIALE